MWFIPEWLEAFWETFSRIAKLVWTVLKSCWHVIVVTGSLLAAIFPHLVAGFEYVTTRLDATWAVLTDATDSMDTAMSAGWPAALASGVAFVNKYAPIAEAAGMV